MIKSLITGGGGFVASHLVDYLTSIGEEVHITTRWNEDLARLKGYQGKAKVHAMELNDLSSCLKVIEQVKPDVIYHLGAQSFVNESFDYPITTMQTNVIGTLNLLEAVRIVRDMSGKELNDGEGDKYSYAFDPMIHVCSSSEVYGLVDKKDIPIKETQAFNPANPYAVSKVGADMVALMYYTNYKLKIIRTRFFTHTGPGRTMMSAECNFARQIALIEKGKQEPILKHGNLNSIRTWADVRDAVKGYKLLTEKGKIGEVYNIGGNEQHTIGEMLNTLLSFSPMKDKIKLEQDPSLMRPYDVTLQVPDISKFKQDTGWEPEISFKRTMLDLLDFWRKQV